MVFVWQHPSLLALEVLWRWLAGVPLLWLLWHALAPAFAAVPVSSNALETMTFFEPVRSIATLAQQADLYRPALVQTLKWWLPVALAIWTIASALGRSVVLRRAAPTLSFRPGIMALYSVVRAMAFAAVLALWSWLQLAAVRFTITEPGRSGASPNLVLFTAEAVLITFGVFALWSLTVWALDLFPLRAISHVQPSSTQGRRDLGAKLRETNLVMGIVRVILLVLALTFSASPLPFQTQETQAFINVWWVGVALFYLLSSDFFHVVRRVAYLRLLQSFANPRTYNPN